MKNISCLLAAAIVSTLFACRKPTEACFSYKPTTGITPSTDVVFDASCSQNVGKYVWSFGDGYDTSTTSSNITHRYPASGSYTVTLGVQSADGKSSGTDKLVYQTSLQVQ